MGGIKCSGPLGRASTPLPDRGGSSRGAEGLQPPYWLQRPLETRGELWEKKKIERGEGGEEVEEDISPPTSLG